MSFPVSQASVLIVLCCCVFVRVTMGSPCQGTGYETGSWRRPSSISTTQLLQDPLENTWWDCPYYDFLRDDEFTGTVSGINRRRKDYKRSHCIYDNIDPSFLTYRHDYFEPGCDMTEVNLESVVKYLFYNRTTVLMGDASSKQHANDLLCLLWGFTVPDRNTGLPIRAFQSSFEGRRHLMQVKLNEEVYRNKPKDHPAFTNPSIYLECDRFYDTRSKSSPQDDIGFARICFFPSGYPAHAEHEITWSTQWKDMTKWLKPRDLLVMNYGRHLMLGGSKQTMKHQLGGAAEVWRSPQFHGMRYKQYPMMIWRETAPQHFSSAEGRGAGKQEDMMPDMCIDQLSEGENPHAAWSKELEEQFNMPVLHFYGKTVHRHKEKCGMQLDGVWDCKNYCEPHSGPIALMTRLLFDKLAIIERDNAHPAQHKVSAEQNFQKNLAKMQRY